MYFTLFNKLIEIVFDMGARGFNLEMCFNDCAIYKEDKIRFLDSETLKEV